MADNLYEDGHLVKLYVQPAPGAAFQFVADITSGDLMHGGKRASTEVTQRGSDIDSHHTSPVTKRDERSFQVTRNPGAVQDVLLQTIWKNKTTVGWMQRGVGPDGTTPSAAYTIESGKISNYQVVAPHGDGGPLRVDISYRPSGPMIIDGNVVGAIAS
jgi:hypothetical protein